MILERRGKRGKEGGRGEGIEERGYERKDRGREGRMTLCNMSIEGGARAGMVAPDDKTFAYIKGRPFAPKDDMFERAVAAWKQLPSGPDASFDKTLELQAAEIAPQVTWGTNPGMVTDIRGIVPSPSDMPSPETQEATERALAYMDLTAGTPIT